MIAGAAGLCAVATAIGGAVVDTTTRTDCRRRKAAPVIPLSRPQVSRPAHHPDYGPPGGPLGDPSRRTSCLSGLGFVRHVHAGAGRCKPIDLSTLGPPYCW